MTDFARLLQALTGGGVEFIIIGGFAATAHGSAHVTVDLDRARRAVPRMASLSPHTGRLFVRTSNAAGVELQDKHILAARARKHLFARSRPHR